MVLIQLLQRSTTEQLTIFPDAPEGDVRAAQPFNRQRMHTFRRRMHKHAGQMFFQQLGDLRPAEIVQLDVHCEYFLHGRHDRQFLRHGIAHRSAGAHPEKRFCEVIE